MPKKYKNSPITEVVCEFKFSADTQWDLTVSGLVFEKVRKKYPLKSDRNLQKIEFDKTGEGMMQKVSVDQYAQFSTEDTKTRVMVGPRVLSVSRLQPYTSWEEFKPEIDCAYTTLSNFIEAKGFQRIGLRYINRIVIPESLFSLDKYFEFRPHGGKKDDDLKMESFIVGYTSSFREHRDACKVQLSTTVSDEPGASTFMLDLDYFLVNPSAVSSSEALDWIEDAHSCIEEIFEGCLTDNLRELFEEEA